MVGEADFEDILWDNFAKCPFSKRISPSRSLWKTKRPLRPKGMLPNGGISDWGEGLIWRCGGLSVLRALVCASLLNLVSLTGTQGGECHKVGGLPSPPAVAQVPSLGRGWQVQGQGSSLPFQEQKRGGWAEECVRPR